VVPDGTPCSDADPCNGTETCQAGACTSSPVTPAPLAVRTMSIRGNVIVMAGGVTPSGAIAPSTTDAVAMTVDAGGTAAFATTLAHPATDPLWVRSKPPVLFKYTDGGGINGGLTLLQLKRKGEGYTLKMKGKNDQLRTLQAGAVTARLGVGNQCYAATLACTKKGKKVRCR
jgi:hypothetical protein